MHIRLATVADIDNLVRTIVSAEKSGTDRFGLATLFGLSEPDATRLIARMLNEEVEGCEFSISSFRVAEIDGRFAGAVGGWVEGRPDDLPSGLLKSNLIGAVFPEEAMFALRRNAEVLDGLRLERKMGALQIEYVFVDPGFRGHGVAQRLITSHLQDTNRSGPAPDIAQVQAFADNDAAIRLYEKLGFRTTRTSTATHQDTRRFLPFDQKVLMERAL